MGEQHAPLRLWRRALAGSERVCVKVARQEQWKGTFKDKGSDGPLHHAGHALRELPRWSFASANKILFR